MTRSSVFSILSFAFSRNKRKLIGMVFPDIWTFSLYLPAFLPIEPEWMRMREMRVDISSKKGERMKHYTITLINKSPNLDLTQKQLDIKKVFQHIEDGGATKRSFKNLHHCQVLQIRRSNIDVAVEESTKSWHPWVGRILANDHGMRGYCHGTNMARMFKWN